MGSKRVSILFACIVGVAAATVGFVVYKKQQKPPASTVTSASTTTNGWYNEQDRNKWNEVYKDPFVQHMRKALNGYLNGTNEGIANPDLVIPASTDENGVSSGLAAFSKDYYQSKFIVLSIVNGSYGGKEINIVFQNKPDRVFWAWVYKPVGEDYTLKGFAENTRLIKPEQMEEFRQLNKAELEDTEHAL